MTETHDGTAIAERSDRRARTEALTRALDERIKMTERQLEATAQQLPEVALLRTIPGLGLLTSTAFLAFVGDVRRFPSERHLSSYLGLTPREHSSGTRRHLGRISKRGNRIGMSTQSVRVRGILRLGDPAADTVTELPERFSVRRT